jgi:hypothetical protein
MMVAVTVLVIMMGILFRFIGQAQQIWTLDNANAEIYENARLFLDVLSTDLQSMVVSDINGQEIHYAPGPLAGNPNTGIGLSTAPHPESNWILAFVTSSGLGTSSDDSSKLVEVGYLLTSDSEVIRYMSTSDDFSNGNWDFYGETTVSNWAGTGSWDDTLTVVAEGVRSVSLQLHTDSDPLLSTTQVTTAGDTALTYAVVYAEMFNKHARLINDSEVLKSNRKFSKVIYLNSGGGAR